ncbi:MULTISPECIES: CsbD family protein [unclassified Streptomyces]|uniref:CsbD family protein n=1 Tax=unclassified Streptomyces TaxID=2593676 RepID=UPI0003767555|nr:MULTISPECIES: CsbD family protein [unclassified Streptomyces]MYT28594.1 CsbD family protein [Streptomyces sp. SID8354]
MGIGKKAKSVSRAVAGQTKETTGKATGDKGLELKGKAEKARARARQALEKGKDTFKH